jgi:hypothetical protein
MKITNQLKPSREQRSCGRENGIIMSEIAKLQASETLDLRRNPALLE